MANPKDKSKTDTGEPASAAPTDGAPEPVPAETDDGVACEWNAAGELVDTTDSRRLELRLGGRTYTHKYDDADGRWVYRAD